MPAAAYSNEEIDSIVQKAASDTGVDAGLLRAMMSQEDPEMKPGATSHKGAVGYMQLMPGTARDLGVKDRANPYENIPAGARYMKWLLGKYGGDIPTALAAYNAGPEAVRRAGNRVPNYPETRKYVNTIMGRYQKTAATPPQARMQAQPPPGYLTPPQAAAMPIKGFADQGASRAIGAAFEGVPKTAVKTTIAKLPPISMGGVDVKPSKRPIDYSGAIPRSLADARQRAPLQAAPPPEPSPPRSLADARQMAALQAAQPMGTAPMSLAGARQLPGLQGAPPMPMGPKSLSDTRQLAALQGAQPPEASPPRSLADARQRGALQGMPPGIQAPQGVFAQGQPTGPNYMIEEPTAPAAQQASFAPQGAAGAGAWNMFSPFPQGFDPDAFMGRMEPLRHIRPGVSAIQLPKAASQEEIKQRAQQLRAQNPPPPVAAMNEPYATGWQKSWDEYGKQLREISQRAADIGYGPFGRNRSLSEIYENRVKAFATDSFATMSDFIGGIGSVKNLLVMGAAAFGPQRLTQAISLGYFYSALGNAKAIYDQQSRDGWTVEGSRAFFETASQIPLALAGMKVKSPVLEARNLRGFPTAVAGTVSRPILETLATKVPDRLQSTADWLVDSYSRIGARAMSADPAKASEFNKLAGASVIRRGLEGGIKAFMEATRKASAMTDVQILNEGARLDAAGKRISPRAEINSTFRDIETEARDRGWWHEKQKGVTLDTSTRDALVKLDQSVRQDTTSPTPRLRDLSNMTISDAIKLRRGLEVDAKLGETLKDTDIVARLARRYRDILSAHIGSIDPDLGYGLEHADGLRAASRYTELKYNKALAAGEKTGGGIFRGGISAIATYAGLRLLGVPWIGAYLGTALLARNVAQSTPYMLWKGRLLRDAELSLREYLKNAPKPGAAPPGGGGGMPPSAGGPPPPPPSTPPPRARVVRGPGGRFMRAPTMTNPPSP